MKITLDIIKSFPANVANRDQSGSPKSMIMGGTYRDRHSTQSQKYATRHFFESKGLFQSYRSMKFHTKLAEMIGPKLNLSQENASKVSEVILQKSKVNLALAYLSKSNLEEIAEGICKLSPETIEFLIEEGSKSKETVDSENKSEKSKGKPKKKSADVASPEGIAKNIFDGLTHKDYVPYDAAMIAFHGRMIANENIRGFNIEAAISMMHSVSVHKSFREHDYFTAMDDFSTDPGAAHIEHAEFCGGSTMYSCCVIDVDQLRSNLEKVTDEAVKDLLEQYIIALLHTSPHGKTKTYFCSSAPSAVYITVSNEQPFNLASAFDKPIGIDNFNNPSANSNGVISPAIDAIEAELNANIVKMNAHHAFVGGLVVHSKYVRTTTYDTIELCDDLKSLITKALSHV